MYSIISTEEQFYVFGRSNKIKKYFEKFQRKSKEIYMDQIPLMPLFD